jgi:hypothetical protein
MKLCCDNIENIKLTKNGNFRDIDNCIILCYNCHKEVHSKDGCRYNQLRTEEC